MGHLNTGRNLEALIPLQNSVSQIVVVGSTSTPKDAVGPATLKHKLLDKGMTAKEVAGIVFGNVYTQWGDIEYQEVSDIITSMFGN